MRTSGLPRSLLQPLARRRGGEVGSCLVWGFFFFFFTAKPPWFYPCPFSRWMRRSPRAPVPLRPARAVLFPERHAGERRGLAAVEGGRKWGRCFAGAMAAALERALREAVAALERGGDGAAAALGAVRTALAAAGGPATLGERERALFGAFLRSLARAPRAARPEGVWQGCFLEGPPGLALCVLLEALVSPGSVRFRLGGRLPRARLGLLGPESRWEAGVRRRGGLES